MNKFMNFDKPEYGPEPLDEEKKRRVYEAIAKKFADKSSIEDAKRSASSTADAADWGQIAEGLVRSRSQALGGQGVDKSFYDGIRDRGREKVQSAKDERMEAIKTYLMDKKGERQVEQDELQVDRLDYDRDRNDSNDEWRQKQYENSESWKQKEFDQRSEQIAVTRSSKDATQARLDAKEVRARNKKSPMQVKKEGLAIIGEKAEDQYSQAISKGEKTDDYDPTSYVEWMDNSSWVPNAFKDPAAIEAKAAADSWIDSYLRDESGAAIPTDERSAYYDIYFPRPGDTEKAVSNKLVLRSQKMENARNASGTQQATAPVTKTPRNISDSQAEEYASTHGLTPAMARRILENR